MADPKIRYDIEAGIRGEADVEQLADTVRKLGDSLEGDLKKQATDAAAALDALGAKRDAVQAFQTLRRETQQLGAELDKSTADIDRLGQELPQAAAATAKWAETERGAREQLAQLRGVLETTRAQQKQLRDTTDESTRSTEQFKEAQQRAADLAKKLVGEVKEQSANVKAATAAAKEARTAERDLTNEYDRAVTSSKKLSTELAGKRTALDQSRSALTAYGLETTNLVGAEKRLDAAIDQVRESVVALAPAFQRAQAASSAAAQRQVADQRTLAQSVQGVQEQLQRVQSIAAIAVGGSFLTGLIKSAAETADEYKNLQARMALVTGEGANFETAFRGVAKVALDTHSPLEETGTLFARIAKTGTDAGLSARDASLQALGLTKTINQSIQLSGAGADASSAAITQLIQGLQSGVLRGEEFNSVMEQAPRLAQVLANGLNVTTGALRGMAEQGQLTTGVVIQALTTQAATVEAEFGKLPLTVGRALQDLSTQWTLYVGAADNGMASSANLAKIIQGLSANLDTLVGTVYAAGKAWAAIKLAGLAADAYRYAAATLASTTAVAANTAATGANTLAQAGNAAALRATATAANAQAAAVVANTARMSAAGSVLGRFSVLLGPVGIGLAAVAPEIIGLGQALGEGIAKWQGYGRAIQDAEAQSKAMEASAAANAQAQRLLQIQLEESRAKAFGLTKEASALIATFDDLVKKGSSASEAIDKIGKGFDLSTLPGFRTAAATLDKLLNDAKITASQFEAAWSDAVKGVDLADFEIRAKAALGGTAREAERMAAVFDATAREAIRRTGLDFDLISGGMSKAARSAINDTETIIGQLQRLRAQGVDVGQALAVSLSKGIEAADGKKSLEALKTQIESVRTALGNKVTDGLLEQLGKRTDEVNAKLAAAIPGIQSVAEAMKVLGVTSDKALKDTASSAKQAFDFLASSGTASARELTDAFVKYATDAIAANKGVADETIKAQAVMRGANVTVDEFGKATVKALAGATQGTSDLKAGAGQAGEAFKTMGDIATDALRQVNDELERNVKEQERANDLKQRAIDLDNKRRGVDASGFAADPKGNRIVAGGELNTLTGIVAFLKNAGVSDDAKARSLALEFSDGQGNIPYMGNKGQLKYGGETLSLALLRAAESITFGTGRYGSGQSAAGSTIPAPTSTQVVNLQLQLNGTNYGTVNTDQAGSNAIRNLLAQFSTAKAASS